MNELSNDSLHQLGVKSKTKTLTERFWEKVAIAGPDECWIWKASKDEKGYGHFAVGGKSIPTHRAAYVLSNGTIADNQYCRHKCEIKSCCNPSHLYLTTENDDLGDRFWEKVKKGTPEECWTWTAHRLKSGGYGQFALHGKPKRAHRISYELANGPIPKGLYVCHTCDTPSCVNPNHLFLGTNSQNILDCIKKGRFITAKRIAALRKKLTPENIHQIRKLAADGKTQREIASRFQVNHATIGAILRGQTWKHVA
jgi:HNH endonuclease/Helix-turn-helix domain